MKEPFDCIDIGSDYCPCYLAETNDCITCSILQGENFCDCNWRGICVYNQYVNNGNMKKNARKHFTCNILDKIEIDENSYILKLDISRTLARQLKEPGAYVFLRGENLPQYFDLPMSVMDVNEIEGHLYVAYQVYGTKTKRLNTSNETIMVRGPYWNGAYGLKNLKVVKNSNTLIIARGIAQAPAVLVIKKLLKHNNKVTLILDKGSTNNIFIKDYIKGLDIKIIEEDIKSIKGNLLIKDILINNDIKLLYSGGSDIIHHLLINILDEIKVNPLLVATNNNEICCGEGICGSCSTYLQDGKAVKACKTQIDIRELIKRRVFVE